ncbi:MAG TPA: type II CAAX endopeptidase family protein, partial [Phototrophicaceae bacterium]|nr:type II CAAX endopeptidase family protein [Phototrophicaceae bacterium]
RFLPASATYDPESPVHTTAWVLTLALIAITVGDFVLNGGIAGMAQSLQANSVGIGDILYEDALWVFAATLGIGLFLRRSPQQALARLGLRLPTAQDMNWGMIVGLVMIGLVIIFSLIWSNLVSAQVMQQETAASDQLAASINSLPLALVISAVVAIGEEIFFRGALQPVFGIWLTSLFFSVLHTQYTLTPATLLIFVTSMGLGWLRQRYSTTASIIGHFFYNFIQLALALLGTSV